MTDSPRKPLVPFATEVRRRLLYAQGLDEEALPLSLSPAERLAARDPGLPASKETQMDNVTPGWKTSEFWLKAVVVLVVLPLLYWLSNEATSPVLEMLKALGGLNPLLALVVPIVGKALMGFIAWAAAKLAANYSDNRTELKVAALAASAPAAKA